MMSMMRVRTILPFLLALPLLAMLAVLVYQAPAPAAAQGADPLPAPSLNLAAASACTSDNPRSYLFANYGEVTGADSYQYRMRWGDGHSWTKWGALGVEPGEWWAVSTRAEHYLKPGETYTMQVRARDAASVNGHARSVSFMLPLADFPSPGGVSVAYTNDERTAARLTWTGDVRSNHLFAVQQRQEGKGWTSESFRQASQVGDASSPYYRDFTGLDPDKNYQFRISAYSGSCDPSPWSGIATLLPPVTYESDGRSNDVGMDRRQASFRTTANGVTYIRWQDWISDYEDESTYVSPDDWRVTVTSADKTRTKETGTGGQRWVRFNNLAIGGDHAVAIQALEGDGGALGAALEFTIGPRHVSAPQPVTGLTLTADGTNLNVNWEAPAAGGAPKRYVVYLVNLDSGRTQYQFVDPKKRGGAWQAPVTSTTLGDLKPGVDYRVVVQVRNRDSRSGESAYTVRGWQLSRWVAASVTMPGEKSGDGEKSNLYWHHVKGNDPVPAQAIGEPTAYVVLNKDLEGEPTGHVSDSFGVHSRLDFAQACGDYKNYSEVFHSFGRTDAQVAANSIRRHAHLYERRDVAEAKAALVEAERERNAYTGDDPAQTASLERAVASAQRELDARNARLVRMAADAVAKCSVAYPAVENLTGADNRYYLMAAKLEQLPTRR